MSAAAKDKELATLHAKLRQLHAQREIALREREAAG